jgi:hydroxymethylpyrimidine/phosphomethylpyrimidine kinase
MKRILIIAASDSGGGAGIQADIKAVTLLGGFAMTAITALTAQNSLRVTGVLPVAPEFVEQQIDAVMEDIGADAVKTGMLFSAEIITAVSRKLRHYGMSAVVVDPVMKSKAGDTLLQDSAIAALKKQLFPLALIVTPNLDEASLLCGFDLRTLERMKDAARKIKDMGPQTVVVKGGHLQGDCVDVFYDGSAFAEFPSPRIMSTNTHGTGCTFASALAAEIARGYSPAEAVQRAQQFVHAAITHAVSLGKGHGPTNPYAPIARRAGLWECSVALMDAVKQLQQAHIGHLIPEVQSNFGYALEGAVTPEDVLAFPGRIIRLDNSIVAISSPQPGASQHIAKIILTVLKYNQRFRSAMNIKYSRHTIERCKTAGFAIASFDRTQEPAAVKSAEGSTLEWGTNAVLSQCAAVPDIIFDTGDVGKEAMIRVLGTTPADVAHKIITIAT